MMSTRETRSGKGFFASRWSLIVGVVVLFILAIAFVRAYYQSYQTQEEIQQLQTEAAALESKKLETLDALHYVQSPAYVEDKARTELNLIKPGEHLTIIPGSASAGTFGIGQPSGKVLDLTGLSNPRQWWNYFFGN